jgi:hypothetical protein
MLDLDRFAMNCCYRQVPPIAKRLDCRTTGMALQDPPFALHPGIQTDELREAFERTGWVQIDPFIDDAGAEASRRAASPRRLAPVLPRQGQAASPAGQARVRCVERE